MISFLLSYPLHFAASGVALGVFLILISAKPTLRPVRPLGIAFFWASTAASIGTLAAIMVIAGGLIDNDGLWEIAFPFLFYPLWLIAFGCAFIIAITPLKSRKASPPAIGQQPNPTSSSDASIERPI